MLSFYQYDSSVIRLHIFGLQFFFNSLLHIILHFVTYNIILQYIMMIFDNRNMGAQASYILYNSELLLSDQRQYKLDLISMRSIFRSWSLLKPSTKNNIRREIKKDYSFDRVGSSYGSCSISEPNKIAINMPTQRSLWMDAIWIFLWLRFSVRFNDPDNLAEASCCRYNYWSTIKPHLCKWDTLFANVIYDPVRFDSVDPQ